MVELLLVILTALITINTCAIIAFYKYFIIIKSRFENVSEILDKKIIIINDFDTRVKELESQITNIRLGRK